jgi:glutathione synthase
MSVGSPASRRALRLAFVMDPLPGIAIDKDTTFAWLLEAQARGHECHFIGPAGLSLWKGEARGLAAPLRVRRVAGDHFLLGDFAARPLRSFDVVFMRKDPPIELEYLYATHVLSHVDPPTRVLNDPHGLRETNEKLYALRFPELVPPTLVTKSMRDVRAFVDAEGGAAVLKPLHASGGSGVVILRADDPNFGALLEMGTLDGQRTVMVQRYLPEAKDGDKRVILIGGEPVGAVLRVPTGKGEHRGNLHVGGRPIRTELTERERAACDALRPRLLAEGLHFVGLDFIGGFLTEVNVTSPTGIQEIAALEGLRLEAAWIDYVERLVG